MELFTHLIARKDSLPQLSPALILTSKFDVKNLCGESSGDNAAVDYPFLKFDCDQTCSSLIENKPLQTEIAVLYVCGETRWHEFHLEMLMRSEVPLQVSAARTVHLSFEWLPPRGVSFVIPPTMRIG